MPDRFHSCSLTSGSVYISWDCCLLSMPEETWPNWNLDELDFLGPDELVLSMSERTWPNWNCLYSNRINIFMGSIHVWRDVAQLKREPLALLRDFILSYPFLLRSGPIETGYKAETKFYCGHLSISAKKWPNCPALDQDSVDLSPNDGRIMGRIELWVSNGNTWAGNLL